MVSIQYLEEERQKLWAKIVDLESLIEKRLPEDEREAKQASRKCSEFKNKCESTKNEVDLILQDVKTKANSIQQLDIDALVSDIKSFQSEILPKRDPIKQQIADLESLFASYPECADRISKLDEVSDEAEDYAAKAEAVFKQITTRKKEVDQLYFEIFGATETDSTTGEKTEIKGSKGELEDAYDKLVDDFDSFSKNKSKEFAESLNGWETVFSGVNQKVESLLPNALTAGLSHAYSEKKNAEKLESESLEKMFRKYVTGLIGVSLIPFLISIYFLYKGFSLEETVVKMPRLVLSILPLYVPVLWVAYSANRKVNLSKRLIEEYTHKEVLSKTFEGLSTQIQNIGDSEISRDLKTRLLYNILEVSSENPGKLISDYNKSDHPLMDALEKSVKLTNSIEHLAKIPGMTKLIGVLDRKSRATLEREDEKAAAALDKV